MPGHAGQTRVEAQEPEPTMALKIACQMDPIDRIDIRGDSTFAILLEAQNRGHEVFYYTPPNLAATSVSRALPRITAAASTSARLPKR